MLCGNRSQSHPVGGFLCLVSLLMYSLEATRGLEARSTRKECLISMGADQELHRPSSLTTKSSQLFQLALRLSTSTATLEV